MCIRDTARVQSVTTKLRLLTRIAFGFRSPDALVALAMLDLGGMCPTPTRPRDHLIMPTDPAQEPLFPHPTPGAAAPRSGSHVPSASAHRPSDGATRNYLALLIDTAHDDH